jgi:hypothetical protein
VPAKFSYSNPKLIILSDFAEENPEATAGILELAASLDFGMVPDFAILMQYR